MKKKKPDLHFEIEQGYPHKRIAGSDEVGRGCVAGPVVAAAVVLPRIVCYDTHPWLSEIHDSKLVNPLVREKLAPLIQTWALSYAIGVATVEEIDQINIFHASHLAMIRALNKLDCTPHHVLIDGKFLPKKNLKIPASAIIKGDQKCLSIAAASILAKVWRDQHLLELDLKYPGYGLAQHKGYPTPAHKLALREKGVTAIHRLSFNLGKLGT